ncbi:MAG: hypothetical protein J6Q65_06395, partial [Lentisphaeria bacterium]|nr:hypothetical protein [Lentisphaeria bacterium]
DFSKIIGKMKPVHAVGQPPIIGWSSDKLFHYLTEAGIPYSRLHDVGGGFGGGKFVDIPNVFPDFNADPEDPASYDFTWTDPLITSLMDAKVEPYYRLGVTIENEVWRKAYRVNPPEDPEKWAKICAGVIRHYTKGWANGFEYDIKYWEIWNEPECTNGRRVMWTGTWEQYLELYDVTSKLLKAEFPEIKIGGYASIGFYALKEMDPESTWCKDCQSYIDLFLQFMQYIKDHNCPMDFFSWHSYDEPKYTALYANYVAEKLKEYGYGHAEQHLNEWNCGPQNRDKACHAAATAGFLISMQNSPVDIGMFYDARCGTSIYGGLFNPMTLRPLKSYWVFPAYNELYRRKDQVEAESDTEDLYVAAAAGDPEGAVLIVNFRNETLDLELDLGGKEITSCRLTDDAYEYGLCNFTGKLNPYSVTLLTVR